jgi:hypothetical protein
VEVHHERSGHHGLIFLPYDRWEGYAAERTEMLEFIRNPDGNTMTDDHLKNVVFLSTDIHAAIYNPAVANPGPGGRQRARDHRGRDRHGSDLPRAAGGDPAVREQACRALPGDPVLRHRPPELRALRRQHDAGDVHVSRQHGIGPQDDHDDAE